MRSRVTEQVRKCYYKSGLSATEVISLMMADARNIFKLYLSLAKFWLSSGKN